MAVHFASTFYKKSLLLSSTALLLHLTVTLKQARYVRLSLDAGFRLTRLKETFCDFGKHLFTEVTCSHVNLRFIPLLPLPLPTSW
jgi:hypothetical protein